MTTKVRKENGIAILEPNGKIIGTASSELWDVLSPQIEASDTPRILINFENVSRVDSSGLGALMGARARCRTKKGTYCDRQSRRTDQKLDCPEPTRQTV